MSFHIEAKKGDIAERILLPGDPLRAKFIAENFFQEVKCYNEVRGMYGYTGLYKGERISAQGTGMGIPSISIYVNELIREYGCQELIRIGTAGSMRDDINVNDVLMATAASTNSNTMQRAVDGLNFSAVADFDLMKRADKAAETLGIKMKAVNVISSDTFYNDDLEWYKPWAQLGVAAVEMEASALYMLCAKYGVKGLCLLTISDHIIKGEMNTSEDREKRLFDMINIALSL
jgi:purine-nucleoside phosphorylase